MFFRVLAATTIRFLRMASAYYLTDRPATFLQRAAGVQPSNPSRWPAQGPHDLGKSGPVGPVVPLEKQTALKLWAPSMWPRGKGEQACGSGHAG